MTGKFVSVGIDHGVTNSCIAYMAPDGPRVVRVHDNDVMPSAVFIDKRGRRRVGQDAISAMMTYRRGEGEGYTGYKPRIVRDEPYTFTAARKTLTAPELAAIVIGELLRAYQEEQSERLRACVIAVPANFEQSACEGMHKAAVLAGLEYFPTIMEPVAAATAFGFGYRAENERWIVFDLGDGTLGVTLLMARGGTLVVPEEGHASDNQLGGRSFDRKLFAYVMGELSKTYQLDKLSESNPAYRPAWGKLMLAVEKVRIDLSRREETRVEVDDLCRDARGNLVGVDVPVTRRLYQHLIAPDIEKAVEICKALLFRNRLEPSQIARLLLVGEATRSQILRAALVERLGIPVDYSIDAMTAVARGAAIFADTVEKPFTDATRPAAPSVRVELQYERQSAAPVYTMVGRVHGAGAGVFVEVKREDGLWSSSMIKPDAEGFFTADLMLVDSGKPFQSQFATRVLSASGALVASVAEPVIWFPDPAVENRLASSIRIGLGGNKTLELLRKGIELPRGGTVVSKVTIVTSKALKKGAAEDVIHIPVLEAVTNLQGTEDKHTDCCLHIDSLTIRRRRQDHRELAGRFPYRTDGRNRRIPPYLRAGFRTPAFPGIRRLLCS
jgi:molecular chaperone DnaK